MTKLEVASLYEGVKSIAWTTYVSKLLADAMKLGAVSFSKLAQTMRVIKEKK